MSVGITHLAYYLPKNSLTHSELCDRFGFEHMERTLTNTGIVNRRVTVNDEIASDLAYNAAQNLISQHNIDKSSIDFLIFASQMPDYLLPTTACILQDRLGLNVDIGAFDLNLGCSQFVYAHSVAYSLVKSGIAKKVLVLTADTPSRIIDPNDYSVVPLFGDGATAAIIEPVEDNYGFKAFKFGTNGKEFRSLIWKSSGLRNLASCQEPYSTSPDFMSMDGQKVFLFTLKTVPASLKDFLAINSYSIEDIDFFCFHQASKMIVTSLEKKLNIPSSKINHVYQQIGNCGGSTVGISLCEGLKNSMIMPGSLVVMSAFGVGLSWGNCVYKVQPSGINYSVCN
jgi:3-oxoacyl-[acyl-carrier-protein] synthase-3